YTTLSAGSTILALFAVALYRRLFSSIPALALVFFAYGLMTGFRQDLLLFLFPLFSMALWGRPKRHWVIAAVMGALGVMMWFLPSAALSEGFTKYVGATSRQGGIASGGSSVFVVGPEA